MVAAGAAGASAVAGAGLTVWRLHRARRLIARSEALQHRPADPALRLLIVGDSTAVGTGASTPSATVAGRFAAAYPRLQIDNRARDGARWRDLPAQLRGPGGARRYDLVLIQAGGNDIVRLTEHDALHAAVERGVRRAAEVGREVVLMPCGNVGHAPLFFAPLSGWLTRRSRELHAMVRKVAARHGAVYVGLFREGDADPFACDRGLHAVDGLHPSDAGYALWWRELQQQADLPRRLAAAA